MKLIDEKGRLFGKINLIDLMVILLLLGAIPIFYFGYKIYTEEVKVEQQAEFFVEEVYCKFVGLTSKDAESITVGDKEMDENGEMIGEVTWVGPVASQTYEIDI